MKNTVKTPLHTSLPRLGFALLLLAILLPRAAFAANVQWEILPDRERLVVSLTEEEGFAGQVSRVSPTGLLLELGVPTAGMGRDLAPENATLFQWTEPRGRALGIFMQTAAFGYVVTRPDRRTVIINVFPDPMGARWTPEGVAPKQPDREAAAPPVAEASPPPEPAKGDDAASPPETAGVAADEAAPVETPGIVRGRVLDAAPPASGDATMFRSRINPGGLSDWNDLHGAGGPAQPVPPPPEPAAQHPPAATASPPAAQQPPATATPVPAPETPAAPPATETPEAAAPPVKVYVDAQGNPVPPPPDPVETLAAVKSEAASGKYKGALELVTPLLTHPELTRDQTEEILHLYAEMLFMANQDNLAEHFDAITSASIAAMNYNQDSPRNAAVYLRLGYINLKVDNTVEAEAYFSRLRRSYPLDENIALTHYYWGEYYYDHNEMQKAADEFQYILSNFSENKYARDAAVGLARSYAALGYYQEAFEIIDYMERRWPRIYLESPPVLELMGDVAYRQGNLDFALEKYMLYYNLMPSGPKADVMLTRIGDVYARKRQLGPAKTAYTRAAELFPDQDGGLVALMRLAEMGINDAPELQTMFSVFQDQVALKPRDIYKKIIEEHPESELVPLAMLKLAMWHLWNNQYEDALRLCTELIRRFPSHELAPRAQEVAMRAFADLAASGAAQNRTDQVLQSWSDNEIIRSHQEALSPESRVALATSMWKQNDPDEALAMVAPLFLGHKDPAYAEPALLLALNINLEHDQWQGIERLAEQVQLWELTPRVKQQLDYATALARENLGRSSEAAPIWSRLVAAGTLPDKQQAYAEYFLAKDAEAERRLQDAYLLGRSALNRFLQMAESDPAHADTGKINSLLASLMDISETAGRLEEALEYAHQFMNRLPADDSQRQGLLFRIAGIYKKQGNTPEWRKTLTELAEKYPDSVYGRTAASALSTSKLTDEAARFAPNGQL